MWRSLLLALAALFLIVSSTEACLCRTLARPCEEYWEASAIFVGRVTDLSAISLAEPGPSKGTRLWRLVRLAIEQPIRGVSGKNIEVLTGLGDSDCGYPFRNGEQYLVHATATPGYGRLTATSCGRTRPLSEAAEDLAYIRELPHAPPDATVYVRAEHQSKDPADLSHFSRKPLAGLKITAEGPPGRLQAITGADGWHEFRGLPAGHYKLRANIPAERNYISEAEVNVHDRGCAELWFVSMFDGQISGTVTDANRQPVDAAKVDLIPAARAKSASPKGAWTFTYRGRFEFSQLPPGRYVLGVNIAGARNPQCPVPRVAYKGGVIRLGESQKLAGYDLRLPPAGEQLIQGTVVWPDGRPAQGVRVRAEAADCPWLVTAGYVWSDPQGHFSTKGQAASRYWVHASVDAGGNFKGKWISKWVHAEPVLVSTIQQPEAVKLVLGSPGPACLRYRDPKRLTE